MLRGFTCMFMSALLLYLLHPLSISSPSSVLDFQLRSPAYFTLAQNPLEPGPSLKQPPLERIKCDQQNCVLTGLVHMRPAIDKGSHSVIRRRLVVEFV